ncbi:MAG: carbohydrate ABC transporter permease [Chloroflexota bacterium]
MWDIIDYPRLLMNTILLAVVSTLGTVLSCVLVAYGFARFRFPGRNLLFTVLIATIFLPAAVTLIPTYTVFVKLGWVGTWLPLLVPTFFANAYDVFLLRQYFMTVPRELDEAARSMARVRCGSSARCCSPKPCRDKSPSPSSISCTAGTTSSGRSSTSRPSPTSSRCPWGWHTSTGCTTGAPAISRRARS